MSYNVKFLNMLNYTVTHIKIILLNFVPTDPNI